MPSLKLCLSRLRFLEDGVSALYFECPVTGHRVVTGMEIDPDSFDSLPQFVMAVRCPYC